MPNLRPLVTSGGIRSSPLCRSTKGECDRLETLAPAERLAFVLHDMFAVSFDEIAPIVGRTPAVAPRGKLIMVLRFTIAGGKITEIDVVADPERLRQLELAVLD